MCNFFFVLYGPSSINFCVVKAVEELKKGVCEWTTQDYPSAY